MNNDLAQKISLGKSLTVHNACHTKEALLAQLDTGMGLHLDLSEVEEADTSAAQLLVAARAAADAQGYAFSISSVSDAVITALSNVGLCCEDDLSPLS